MAREGRRSPALGSYVEFHRPFSYGPDLDLAPPQDSEHSPHRWSAISIISAYHRTRGQSEQTIVQYGLPDAQEKEKDTSTALPSVHVEDVAPSIYGAPIFPEKPDEEQGRPLTINRDLQTRNFCIVALVLGYLISAACLGVGARIILGGRVPVPSWLLDKVMSMGRSVRYKDLPFHISC
jgi:hypothetical protein